MTETRRLAADEQANTTSYNYILGITEGQYPFTVVIIQFQLSSNCIQEIKYLYCIVTFSGKEMNKKRPLTTIVKEEDR
jgi:hypothetical protein